MDYERLEIQLDCKRKQKEWAELRDSVEEQMVKRKKLERQWCMCRYRREDIQIEIEECKKLENLRVALDDIATEVFKSEMALSFDMSNLEESGMENCSMIYDEIGSIFICRGDK
ncbi:hypothetical protein Rs2_02698 [Raphanus sativus]|nr:hypothetical protein Rs2_02698 [Raphanus sativus]